MKKVLVFLAALFAVAAIAQTTFSGRIIVRPDWSYVKTRGQSTNTETFDELLSWVHTSGTNADQMAAIVTDETTLTNSQERVVDLLAVTDGFGDSVAFATVRFIALTASEDNVDPIEIGNGGPDAFCTFLGTSNDVVRVRPGGIFLAVAPDATAYAVGTSGDLRIANTGTNTAAYVLYVGGAE
jgi:hypothetical protein